MVKNAIQDQIAFRIAANLKLMRMGKLLHTMIKDSQLKYASIEMRINNVLL